MGRRMRGGEGGNERANLIRSEKMKNWKTGNEGKKIQLKGRTPLLNS